MTAVRYFMRDAVKLLIEVGADINIQCEVTAAHIHSMKSFIRSRLE
jgi:hypothetical protein